jgi:transcriptional regulator with PAS, ATPase and Fis domain
MQEVFALVLRAAPTRATVLLAGESGVGKDMIARAIHYHSPRKDKPFIKINCTAIPENLMESELFGYEKGAFTGANMTKPGKFELADTGTVFLDEIGDVPMAIQVKLLRILQEREFERLGSNKVRHIDVRVVAATNVDLRRALEEGTFREDLYYRLNVLPINIPALRERRDDIPYLADHFIRKHAAELGTAELEMSADATDKLMAYHWPGNVRELENILHRAQILADGTRISLADLPAEITRLSRAPAGLGAPSTPGDTTLREQMRRMEAAIVLRAIEDAGGDRRVVAQRLGMGLSSLYRKLEEYEREGITTPTARTPLERTA